MRSPKPNRPPTQPMANNRRRSARYSAIAPAAYSRDRRGMAEFPSESPTSVSATVA